MTHYREFYDKNYLAGEDLEENDSLIMTIKIAESEEVQSVQGKNDKLVISFEETDKKYIPGIMMSKVIATIAGSRQVEDWIGTKIELHQEMTKVAGEDVPAIRLSRPVDRTVLKKIGEAKTRKDLEVIYKALKPHEKTDKTITAEMIRIKKTLEP